MCKPRYATPQNKKRAMSSRILSEALYWLRMGAAQTLWMVLVFPFILLELAWRLFNYITYKACWANAYIDFCRMLVEPIAPARRERRRKTFTKKDNCKQL